MTGTFESKNIRGSSMSGESHIQQSSPSGIGQALGTIAETGVSLYGAKVKRDTEVAISHAQEDFLSDLSDARGDIAEADRLREGLDGATDLDVSVLETTKRKIQNLEQQIAARRINPTQAMTRIEALKREGVAKAPWLSREISGLTGSRASTFDAETSQMIKETNAMRDAALEMGYNPDVPSQMNMAIQKLQLDTEIQMKKNLNILSGEEALRYIPRIIDSQINQFSTQAANLAAGISAGTADQASVDALRNSVAMYRNGGEELAVRKMIEAAGLDYSQIPDETVKRLSTQVRGAAESIDMVLSGKMPAESLQNAVSLLQDKVMIKLRNDDPALFTYITLSSKVPGDPISSMTAQTIAGDRFLEFFKGSGLKSVNLENVYPDYPKEGDQASKAKWFQEAVEIQDHFAKVAKDFRKDVMVNGIDSVAPEAVHGMMKTMNGQMQVISKNPRLFSPKIFDEVLNSMASDELMQAYDKADPEGYAQFVENAGPFVKAYVNGNLVPDLEKELNKTDDIGTQRNAKVRDMITATVQDGVIKFVPNTGWELQQDIEAAETYAAKFNRMYASRLSNMKRVVGKVTEFEGDSLDNVILGVFQKPLERLGEPARLQAEQVVAKKDLLQVRNDLSKLAVSRGERGEGRFDEIEYAGKALQENLGSPTLRKNIVKHYTQVMVDTEGRPLYPEVDEWITQGWVNNVN